MLRSLHFEIFPFMACFTVGENHQKRSHFCRLQAKREAVKVGQTPRFARKQQNETFLGAFQTLWE